MPEETTTEHSAEKIDFEVITEEKVSEVENDDSIDKAKDIEGRAGDGATEIESEEKVTTDLPYTIESRDTDIDIISDLKQKVSFRVYIN